MTRKRLWIVAAAVLVTATGAWFYLRAARGSTIAYRHVALERGNLESTISATGKLGAVTTVQVGTQVSGQVSAIYADFNDHVKKGQLIARIDPTLQQQAVREAEAGLARNQADLGKANSDFTRAKTLHDGEVISDADFDVPKYALAVARANVTSGNVALDKARRNLSYTSIYAPIDGIVIERNVDVGQTVAASLSAPQVFLIANDLSQMQILATVDESDVDQIREGMPVHFTVQAAGHQVFTGVVRQLRLQSTTTENVVNYTVVVGVENAGGKLLPGMTATVAFLTGSATDVFLAPNAALRFTPASAKRTAAPAVSAAETGTRGTRGSRSAGATPAARDGVLWYLDARGKLVNVPVKLGITDGQRTEVRSEALAVGMQVVTGTSTGAASTTANGSSPFQSQSSGGPPGPRGGGF